MATIVERLAKMTVDSSRGKVLQEATKSYAEKYLQIMGATGGVRELNSSEAMKKLEEIRKIYGSLGVYRAVYQAVGRPETRPANPYEFNKPLEVSEDTLDLTEGKRAYSLPRYYGVADVSDTGREVVKTAEIRLSKDEKQIIFVNPQHETNNYSGGDEFKNWGDWTTLSDGTALFTPANIGHTLSARFNPYRDSLILEENVLFSNPDVREFSQFRVPITFISLHSSIPIGDMEAPRLQRILKL